MGAAGLPPLRPQRLPVAGHHQGAKTAAAPTASASTAPAAAPWPGGTAPLYSTGVEVWCGGHAKSPSSRRWMSSSTFRRIDPGTSKGNARSTTTSPSRTW